MNLSKSLVSVSILSSLFTAFAAQSEEISNGPDRFRAAIGVMSESSPFVDVDNETIPILAGNIKYGGFYWLGNEFGYRVIENKNFQLAALVRPFGGFDLERDDMAEGFKGLDEREGEMEYGIAATFNTGPVVTTITPLLSSEGNSVELDFSKKWITESYLLKASVFATYHDSDYQNYYFGVTEAEAANPLNFKVDNAYQADSGTDFGVKVIGAYNISESFYVQGLVEYVKLDSSIKDSPIVDSDSVIQFGIGIGYTF